MASIVEVLGRIWKFIRKRPTVSGSIVYGWLCLLGMLHARSYYLSFDVDIFDFAGPSDFLLVVVSKVSIVLYVWLNTMLGTVFVIIASFIILVLLFVFIFSISIPRDIKNCMAWAFKSVNSRIRFVIQIFIALLHTAWAFFVDLVRTVQKTFTGPRQTGWKGYTASFHSAWEDCTISVRDTWKDFTISFYTMYTDLEGRLLTVRKEFKKSLDDTKSLRQGARKSFVTFFWGLFYILITGIFIFLTFFVPSYLGEQDAGILVGDRQIKQSGNIRGISSIYNKASYIYSKHIHPCLLSVGNLDKQENRQDPPFVRIGLRQDPIQSGTHLPRPDRLLFLGTTSSFHFFYECGEASNTGTDSKDEEGTKVSQATLDEKDAPKCEKGRPFIIPTANIASLEFDPKAEKETPTPPEVRNHCGPGWEKMATIGPFSVGEHTPQETNERKIKKLVDQLVNDDRFLVKAKTLRQLMLIGRVDITPLSNETRNRYGSNNGLAQARAKWVRDGLVEGLRSKRELTDSEKTVLLERTILLSAGPLHVRESKEEGPVTEADRAKDRSVEVWACGDQEPEQVISSRDSPAHQESSNN